MDRNQALLFQFANRSTAAKIPSRDKGLVFGFWENKRDYHFWKSDARPTRLSRLWGHFLRIAGIFKCFVLFAASCRRASLSEKQQEVQSTCEKQQEAQSEKQALTSNKHL